MKPKRGLTAAYVIVCVYMLIIYPATAQRLVIVSPPPNGHISDWTDLSYDGYRVAGSMRWVSHYHPFVWSEAEGFRYLTPQGGYTQNVDEAITGRVWGMSGSGVVVGGTGTLAFRWKEGQGVQYLSPPSGSLSATATGASWDGSTVVGHSSRSGAVVWDAQGMPRTIVQGSARAVSADGRVVVGGTGGDDGLHLFRWTEATGLQRLVWGGSAYGVSADGSVIVGHGLVGNRNGALRWTEDLGPQLILPANYGGYALNVSADGRVIVGYVEQGPHRAFRWTESGGFELLGDVYQDIVRPHRVRLMSASSVSGNGRFITGGAESRNSTHIYWLDTVPEPSGLLALGLGLRLLWKRRKVS